MFDSETSGVVVGGGDMTGLGGSRVFLQSCIPFVLAILTGRGGVE